MRASEDGRVLFSADEDEITIGAEKLKVTGTVDWGLETLFNSWKNVQLNKKLLYENVWSPYLKLNLTYYRDIAPFDVPVVFT